MKCNLFFNFSEICGPKFQVRLLWIRCCQKITSGGFRWPFRVNYVLV